MDATSATTAVTLDWQTLLTDFALTTVGAIIGSGIVGTIGWLWGSSYLQEKAKNLATKQDVAAITREVQQVKAEFQRARDAQRH